MTRSKVALTLAFSLAAATSCLRAGVFVCEEGECNAGGRAGVCQANGHCGYPDEGCESGYVYEDAGDLSGTCVPAGGADTTETGTDGTTTDTTTVGETGLFDMPPSEPECGDGVLEPGEVCPTGAVVLDVSGDPVHLELEQLDADPNLDLVVVLSTTDQVSILLGDGEGSFGDPADYPVSANPVHCAVEDLDTDGVPDVVSISQASPGAIDLLSGNGDGTFASAVTSPAGDTPKRLRVADLDDDGVDEVVATDASAMMPALLIWSESDTGLLEQGTAAVDGGTPHDVVLADWRAAAHLDAWVSLPEANALELYTGLNLTLGSSSSEALSGAPAEMAIADLDDDGRPDLAVTTPDVDEVAIRIVSGNGSLQARPPVTVVGPLALALADVDGDGIVDLVVGHEAGFDVALGTGDGDFGEPVAVDTPGPVRSLAVADLDGDDAPDFVVTAGQDTVAVVLSDP